MNRVAVCECLAGLSCDARLGGGFARLLVLFSLAFSSVCGAQEAPRQVGGVTLLIGAVQVQRGGESIALTRGATLQVGDGVQTQANGHVHIKFVDGALVSVRPSSSLKILEYRYDQENPSASVVRFELETGVVRAISGRAAESAKDKFRLNTPLAAIGVRGTDFVVEASQGRVNAVVNQGAIVVSPFDGQCRAEGLGPCSSAAARELSAALKGMALTYSSTMASPQLLPMGQLKGSSIPSAVQPQLVEQSEVSKASQSQQDGKAASSAGQIVRGFATDSLVWGRWGGLAKGDSLTESFLDAMQGRSVTVGDGYYFLFRKEAGVSNLLALDQGTASFNLKSSSAAFVDANNVSQAASVASGGLTVNFSSSEFSTSLKLQSPTTADQTLTATGKVDTARGIFLSSPTQPASVAGAVSLDTRQAGYLFSLPAAGGAFRGATLWAR